MTEKVQGREPSLVLLNGTEASFKGKPTGKYVSICLCFSFLSGCQNVTCISRVLSFQNIPCGCPVGQMIRTTVVLLCEQLFSSRSFCSDKDFKLKVLELKTIFLTVSHTHILPWHIKMDLF